MMESMGLLFVALGFGTVEHMNDPDDERDSDGMSKVLSCDCLVIVL